MVRIQKANGSFEEFSKGKLESSIAKTGASADVVKRVAAKVRPLEGMQSGELRHTVAQELSRESPALSSAYASTKNLRVQAAEDIRAGVARLPDQMLQSLGLKAGQKAHLAFGGKSLEVKVERAPGMAQREMLLSRSDLQKLGASEGSRVGVMSEKR
jgi:hypothetical protein